MQAKILGECVGVVGFGGVDRKQCARVCMDEWIDEAKLPTEFAERLFWLMPRNESLFIKPHVFAPSRSLPNRIR